MRKKSLKAFKDKVRAKTGRSRGASMERIVADLNPMLRGWFNYFKHAVPSDFRLLDGFIRRRLRAILRKQEKRPGFGRCPDDHQRWPNAFFADLGLFTLSTARYARETFPMRKPTTGEPCAGEPHARFGGRGGESLPYPYQLCHGPTLAKSSWSMRGGWVYIITNRPNGTLYTGVTNNIARRAYEHRQGLVEGFTQRYRLKRLVLMEFHEDIRTAIQRERNMKHWPRAWKAGLIHAANPDWRDLYDELNS